MSLLSSLLLSLAGAQGHGAAAPTAVGAKAEEIVLSLLYQLVVILLMTRIVTWAARRLGQTDVSMGYVSAPWFHARLAPEVPVLGFRLFFAVAMSIRAIPILGRIFMELGLSHTRTAALTISAAAIDDVSGWLILGAISLIVKGAFSWGWAIPRLAGLAAYLAVVFLVVRKPLRRALSGHLEQNGGLRMTAVPWMLLLLFVSATITSRLGVFAIIGGFVIGVALHDDRRFVEEWWGRTTVGR